ncbi:MAG: hypothetical protein OXU64_03475 [Gemmatimonadota bacterium]|nr:hypothetical protein [Gemmatimonadota bacterium]
MKTMISVALAAVVAAIPVCTGAMCDIENARLKHGIEIPDLDMLVGETMEVDLGDYYNLIPRCVEDYRDHGLDVFEATSADPAAVAVSIAADLTTLEIAARKAADSVRVTVVGVDHDPGPGHEFVVRVRAR